MSGVIDSQDRACAIREDYTDVWCNRGIVPAELDQDPESGNEGKLTEPDCSNVFIPREYPIDSVMMTTSSGGEYDGIGDSIGMSPASSSACILQSGRWIPVPPHKKLSWLLRKGQ